MESALSSDALVSNIDYEISKIEKNLKGTDENLRRITGRDFFEPRQGKKERQHISREDGPPRPHARPGVFARLGAPVLGNPKLRAERQMPESRRRVLSTEDLEDVEPPRKKPSLSSSVIRPVNDGRSRTEALAEQKRDKASVQRNRRMLSSLLGTLNAFKSDEAKLKDKEEQRAAIDRKLEEKSRAEKEELRREKVELFNQRKEQRALIRNLTLKKHRIKEHEAWEEHQRKLAQFIRTKTKPCLYWYPKKVTSQTESLVAATKKAVERELTEVRLKIKEEVDDAFGGNREISPKHESLEEQKENREQDLSIGEGGDLDEMACADILDYEETGVLDYEEPSTGKNTERVIVQVGRDEELGGSRKVELVSVTEERKCVQEVSEKSDKNESVNGTEKHDSDTSSDSEEDSSTDSSSSSSESSSSSSSDSDTKKKIKTQRMAVRKSVEEKRKKRSPSSSEEDVKKSRSRRNHNKDRR